MLIVEPIVNSFFNSVTWLLSETTGNQVWLVDCGDIPPIINKIGKRAVAGVLLTHAHFDHIYGLPELLHRFPECCVYTNAIGRDTLASPKLNLSLYHGTPLSIVGPNVITTSEGFSVPLYDGFVATVYDTPGHHPSSLTFMVGEHLFTGDAYIPGCKVVTNLPNGDKKLAQESLTRIMNMAEGKIIHSGHQV